MAVVEGSAVQGSGTGAQPLSVLLAAFILVAGFVAGSAGQSVISLGAPADVSASAAVAGTAGGIGTSQPARVSLQIGVINSGDATVQVMGAWADTATTIVRGMTPGLLTLDAGRTGSVALDVSVRCGTPAELTVPALRLQGPNGQEQELPVAGAQALIGACAVGATDARPLRLVSARAVTLPGQVHDKRRNQSTSQSQDQSNQEPGRLDLSLTSPTGRAVQVRQVRAGGQELPMIPAGPVVTSSVVTIGVLAPASCPAAWRLTGIPGSVIIDVAGGGQVPLVIGAPLTTWLLSTTCRAG